jgi:hypothetical protein
MGLLMWGVLSDERMGVSSTVAAGPCQRSHSRVRVPASTWNLLNIKLCVLLVHIYTIPWKQVPAISCSTKRGSPEAGFQPLPTQTGCVRASSLEMGYATGRWGWQLNRIGYRRRILPLKQERQFGRTSVMIEGFCFVISVNMSRYS